MAKETFWKESAEFLRRLAWKSQDNAWVTQMAMKEGPLPLPQTLANTQEQWTKGPVTPQGPREEAGKVIRVASLHLSGINSPTFWPPPATRLLMYSGPSLCLRALWMAWYSSAVYRYYNPERKTKSTFLPFLTSPSLQVFWSPESFALLKSIETLRAFVHVGYVYQY